MTAKKPVWMRKDDNTGEAHLVRWVEVTAVRSGEVFRRYPVASCSGEELKFLETARCDECKRVATKEGVQS